jgi:hypothetical protein
MPGILNAGSAAVDVSPRTPQFLFGYPHVSRMSTGVHDPLLSSALYLSDGRTELVVVASDVFSIGKEMVQRVRERITRMTGIPAAHIMVTATHTHSGPIVVRMINSEADPIVPAADPAYVRQLEDGIVEAATRAHGQAQPAEIGLAVADGSGVGTNRHDPAGPADPQVPVLIARNPKTGSYIAAMVVSSMHPTVLHEDSTLVSGDFPGMARQYLQEQAWGRQCPVVWLTGPCGDQSPRHVTRGNTFEEARRLGAILGQSMARDTASIEYRPDVTLAVETSLVDLPRRDLPSVASAREIVEQAAAHLAGLQSSAALRAAVRTAECDLFGAEETLCLAMAAADGRLEAVAGSVMPAEIMAVRVGPWSFVGWPGETYVEFALAVKTHRPNCFVVSLANGELQGYLVTREAVRQNTYEALNAIFASPASGDLLVRKTFELLGEV